MAGRLVLVVGPSGAGKDTLIAAAADRLVSDPRFTFPKRLVTRKAMAELENHDTIDHTTFDTMRATNDYALCWEAHGLGYIIPRQIEDEIAESKTVICNGSRRILDQAIAKYPHAAIVHITADRAVRAARLATRGRENKTAIDARLAREIHFTANGINFSELDNSGSLGSSLNKFIDKLNELASTP